MKFVLFILATLFFASVPADADDALSPFERLTKILENNSQYLKCGIKVEKALLEVGAQPYAPAAQSVLDISITHPKLNLPVYVVVANVRSRIIQQVSFHFEKKQYLKEPPYEILSGDVINELGSGQTSEFVVRHYGDGKIDYISFRRQVSSLDGNGSTLGENLISCHR